MNEFINFRDYLQNENDEKKENCKSGSQIKSKNELENSFPLRSNVKIHSIETSSKYQSYSDGVLAAINDKSDIRWTTFFISIPFGLFPWIFGLLGGNKVPQKYFLHNCSFEFVMGYKSKKKGLKFFPSFMGNLFGFPIGYLLIRIVLITNFPMSIFDSIR